MRNLANRSSNPERQLIDIRRYLRIFWKRKLFIIIPAVLVIGASIYYAFYMTDPLYEASATIIFREKPQFVRSLDRYVVEELYRGRLGAVRSQIRSTGFLNRVISNLGLDLNPGFRQGAEERKKELPEISLEEIINRMLIGYLRRAISVKEERGNPNLFRIVATTRNPDEAVRLADAVANIFIDERRSDQIQKIRTASDFTVEQLSEYKKRLEESERRLQEYEKRVLSRSARPDEMRSERLSQVSTLMLNVKANLRRQSDRFETLETQAESAEEKRALKRKLPYDSRLSSLRKDFLEMEAELGNLLLERSWKDPGVVSINERIYRTRETLRSRIDRIISQEYPRLSPAFRKTLGEIKFLEIELETIKGRQRKLQKYIDDYRRFVNNSAQSIEEKFMLDRLREEVGLNRRVYNMFLEQSSAAQISETLEITKVGSKFEILEPAQRPFEPKRQKTKRILLMGCFLGLGLGFGLAWGLEYIDRSLKTVEDMESYLGLPVLGTIPQVTGFKVKRWWSKPKVLATVVALSVICMAMIFILLKFPYLLSYLK